MTAHHVPRHWGFMFLRRSGNARLRPRVVRGALPPGRVVWERLRPPQGSREVWRAQPPPIVYLPSINTIAILENHWSESLLLNVLCICF